MKEVLITSSVLIGVILLLRRLLRGKVSQRLIYAAWALVVLRLLIPIQIGQLDFSLLTAARPVTQAVEQVTDRQVAGVTDQDAYRQVLQEYIDKDPSVFTPVVQGHIQSCVEIEMSGEEIAEMIDKVYTQQEVFIPQVQPQVQQQVDATAAPVTVGQILTGIWMTGMAVMAVWFLIANLIFLRRAKKDSVEAEFDGVRVRISPNVPTPCVVGLLRPVIYLTPAIAENEQGRRHVLAHEQVHLRHGDHIWALLRCICLCVYWFDPLVWIAAARSRRDCELACDESALKKLGDGERMAYGKTLLDVVSQSRNPAHLIHTATAMNESKKQLTERVKYIVKKPRNILIAAICLILVASIVTGCAFLGGNPGTSADPTDPPAQPTDPTSPGVPDPPSDGDVFEPADAETNAIVEKLVEGYSGYLSVGSCCSYEPISEDMSAYLSDSQKQNYHNFQYRITCCHTAQEFQAHIDRTIAKDLQTRDDIAQRLFTDDNGQLYLIVVPMGSVSYRYATVGTVNGRLYAKSGAYDEDGWFADAYFAFEETDGNLVITRVYRTDRDEIPAELENVMFPMHLRAIFDNPDSWYRRALTSSYDDPANANIAKFFNLGFSDEPAITDQEWEALKNVPGFQRNEKLHRLPKDRMDAALCLVFGLKLDKMNGIGMEKLTYLESTDCYYLMEGQDNVGELHFEQPPRQGFNYYTDGNFEHCYVYIGVAGSKLCIQQNSVTYWLEQTTQLAGEHLGMTRLEFLYASSLMIQKKMEAEGWSEADRERVYWNAHSIKNRRLYMEDGVLMMQAQYSSLTEPADPLHQTLYIPFEAPAMPATYKADSFRWLIEMANHVDGFVSDAHAGLLLECAVVDPNLFLRVLSEFDQDTIDICWGQLYYGVLSLEDANALNGMLTGLSRRTDLNDREKQTLNKLLQEPVWYSYSIFLDP